MNDVIKITQDLIRCPSVTPKDEGAQELLAALLSDAGFECHHLPFGEGEERVPNLFARIGASGPHICYAGHTDVVPPGDESKGTYGPFNPEIKDGILYGRGASDMKGSVAAFAAGAIAHVNKNGAPENGSISLLITGDEEGVAINGTAKVLEWMDENGHIPDVSIVGEPSNPDQLGDELKIGRRGSLTCVVEVRGRQGHVAYPERADNPMPRLARVAAALSDYEFDTGNAYFPPTNLEITSIDVGNPTENVIPNAGTIHFNIRFNDIWDSDGLVAKLHEIIAGLSDDYQLDTRCGAVSFLTQPGAWSDVVSSAVEEITGRKPELSTKGGTSDARFIQAYSPVVEFGPINNSIHQIDEHAKVEDLENLTVIYERIIELYLAQ